MVWNNSPSHSEKVSSTVCFYFFSDFSDFIIWFWVSFNWKRVPPCVTISRLDSVTQIYHGMGQLGHQTIVLGHIWNQPWNWHTNVFQRSQKNRNKKFPQNRYREKKLTRDSEKQCRGSISSKYQECKPHSIYLSSEGFLVKFSSWVTVRFFVGSVSEKRERERARCRVFGNFES